MQTSGSMLYCVSPADMAPVGHSLSQAPQEIHASVIRYAMRSPPIPAHSTTTPAAGQDRRGADRFSPNCLGPVFHRRLPLLAGGQCGRAGGCRNPGGRIVSFWAVRLRLSCPGPAPACFRASPSCSRAQGAGAPFPPCRSSRIPAGSRLLQAVPRPVRPTRFHFRTGNVG